MTAIAESGRGELLRTAVKCYGDNPSGWFTALESRERIDRGALDASAGGGSSDGPETDPR